MTGAALHDSYASSTASTEDLEQPFSSAPSPSFLDAALGYYSVLERPDAEYGSIGDDYDQARPGLPPAALSTLPLSLPFDSPPGRTRRRSLAAAAHRAGLPCAPAPPPPRRSTSAQPPARRPQAASSASASRRKAWVRRAACASRRARTTSG